MGKKGGATPVVDKSKASEANLNVIKRIDPDVEEVRQSLGDSGARSQGRECCQASRFPWRARERRPPQRH